MLPATLRDGTVSNENFREVGSSCIAERRGIEIVDEGAKGGRNGAFRGHRPKGGQGVKPRLAALSEQYVGALVVSGDKKLWRVLVSRRRHTL